MKRNYKKTEFRCYERSLGESKLYDNGNPDAQNVTTEDENTSGFGVYA